MFVSCILSIYLLVDEMEKTHRKKRSVVKMQVRQITGDMNTAMSGLSQPASTNSGGAPNTGSSSLQPNSMANTGLRPGDNLSSGGSDGAPTIPGSVGVPASIEATVPQTLASPFQAIDLSWWRSLRGTTIGNYKMAVIVEK